MEKDEIIIARAHEILNETIKEQEFFKEERQIIYSFIKSCLNDLNPANIERLQQIENLYDKVCLLQKDSQKIKNIKSMFAGLNQQEIRKEDGEATMAIFVLTDKNKQKYSFFTRDSASDYKEMHKEKFDDADIEVDQIRNIDLEKLINIIK